MFGLLTITPWSELHFQYWDDGTAASCSLSDLDTLNATDANAPWLASFLPLLSFCSTAQAFKYR
jgi:hypothetical protein